MLQMKNVRSSNPPSIAEKPVCEYKQESALHPDRVTKCFLNGVLVGQRVYNREGKMILEPQSRTGPNY
jgi:hypothetical protein